MLKIPRYLLYSYPKRTFKNFGHKRQKIPTVTMLWHGALTFGFIGLGIEWNSLDEAQRQRCIEWAWECGRIKNWIFGDTDLSKLNVPID